MSVTFKGRRQTWWPIEYRGSGRWRNHTSFHGPTWGDRDVKDRGTVFIYCYVRKITPKHSGLKTAIAIIAIYFLSLFLWIMNSDKAQEGQLISDPWCLRAQLEGLKAGDWNHLRAFYPHFWLDVASKSHNLTCAILHWWRQSVVPAEIQGARIQTQLWLEE